MRGARLLEVSADDLNDCEDAAFGASVKRMPPWGALLLVSAVGVEVFLQLVGDKFLGSIGKERADSRDTPLGGGSERIERETKPRILALASSRDRMGIAMRKREESSMSSMRYLKRPIFDSRSGPATSRCTRRPGRVS